MIVVMNMRRTEAQRDAILRRLQDIGLTESQIKDNLLFTADKVSEMMNSGMTRKDGKEWFGAAPPDLSVIARTRGADGALLCAP